MSQLVKVAELKDIPEGEAICVKCGNDRVAIFNVEGTLYAMSDMCPHAGGPLSQGWVENGEVTCPWHGWTFSLNPETERPDGVLRYRVHLEGDNVLVEIPG